LYVGIIFPTPVIEKAGLHCKPGFFRDGLDAATAGFMPRQKNPKRRRKHSFPSSRKWAKIIQNCNILIPNGLRCPFLVKKYVVKPAGFSYVHCNCTAWCRGKQDLPRGALGAKQENITNKNQTTSEEPDEV
jgi:hypothetical protein